LRAEVRGGLRECGRRRWGGAGGRGGAGAGKVGKDGLDGARVLDGGEDAQLAATAGQARTSRSNTRRIRAAQVHAPGLPAARGLASNWRAVDSGVGRA
jgi:hypothetical protein